MKALMLAATAALAVPAAIEPADAWMRGGGDFHGGWGRTAGGGFYHEGDTGGFSHATEVGPGGVAHESDAGGAWHGTAANGYGAYHGGDYGGYYHGTYANGYGAWHTGAYGAYYHQPVVVNSYGAGCYNCGYGGWGAAAAGAAIGAAAVGTAAAAAAAPVVAAPPAVWPIGMTVGYLPAGCVYVHRPIRSWYQCPAGWLEPVYGANGLYYRVVPAPL